jgi:fatty acid desaturase
MKPTRYPVGMQSRSTIKTRATRERERQARDRRRGWFALAIAAVLFVLWAIVAMVRG